MIMYGAKAASDIAGHFHTFTLSSCNQNSWSSLFLKKLGFLFSSFFGHFPGRVWRFGCRQEEAISAGLWRFWFLTRWQFWISCIFSSSANGSGKNFLAEVGKKANMKTNRIQT